MFMFTIMFTTLPLHVLPPSGPPLIGIDWLQHISLNWRKVHALKYESNAKVKRQLQLKELLHVFSPLFTDELGEVSDKSMKLALEEKAIPRFLKAHPVPFALRPKVEEELIAMQKMGRI